MHCSPWLGSQLNWMSKLSCLMILKSFCLQWPKGQKNSKKDSVNWEKKATKNCVSYWPYLVDSKLWYKEHAKILYFPWFTRTSELLLPSLSLPCYKDWWFQINSIQAFRRWLWQLSICLKRYHTTLQSMLKAGHVIVTKVGSLKRFQSSLIFAISGQHCNL